MKKRTLATQASEALCVMAVLACAACSGTETPGGPSATDAGTDDPQKRLPITSIGTRRNPSEKDADWSCYGQYTKPARTSSAASFTMKIEDFQEDNQVTPDVTVQVFSDNVIADTCTSTVCTEGMTDAAGHMTATAHPGAWFAYRVLPKQGVSSATTVVGSVQYNEEAPAAGGTRDGVSVSLKTLELIPTVLGFSREPGTAIIAGRLVDCNGEDVYGAVTKLYKADGTQIAEGVTQKEPHYRYFDGESFPSATHPFTNVDGLYAIANLPIEGSAPVTIELFGRRAGDDEPVKLGREQARIFADTVTIINAGPLRREDAGN